MKKFIVYLLVIVLAVSLGFAVFYLVRDNEIISISTASIYKDVGDTFTIDVNHENKKSYTEISISTSNENVVSYDAKNNVFTAKSGGVARINFRTTNAKFRNLWCDVVVGDGTVESPFYITTPEQLASIGMGTEISDENNIATGVFYGDTKYVEGYSKYQSDKCYKLVADIDVKDVNEGFWLPLRTFSGRFDGNGYTISNINIDKEGYDATFKDTTGYNPNIFATDNVGLFQKVTATGIVYNLKLTNYTAKGSYVNFGTIAGTNQGTIERIEVKDALIGIKSDVFGGLVGKNISSEEGVDETYKRHIARIDRSSVNMTLGMKIVYDDETTPREYIVGASKVNGGLVGENEGGTIVYSYVRGTVNFVADTTEEIIYGGLVGKNKYLPLTRYAGSYSSVYQGANIKDCYSDLKTNFVVASTNSKSRIAGAIAINEDYSNSYFEEDTTKQNVQNFLIGNYYNKDNLNSAQTGITKSYKGIAEFKVNDKVIPFYEAKNIVYGLVEADMKVQENFVSHTTQDIAFDEEGKSLGVKEVNINWLFGTVWAIDAETNDGKPYLNYQLVYIPDDFRTVGVPVVANSNTYYFEMGEIDFPVTIISGTNGRLSIEVGDVYQIKVDPDGVDVEWFSSDASIAKVDKDGKVTGVAEGVVTITATTKSGSSDTITVIVTEKSYELKNVPSQVSVYVGKTYQIKGITVTPEATISYESQSPDIAIVSTSGIVTGVAKGETYIIVSAGNTKRLIKVTVLEEVKDDEIVDPGVSDTPTNPDNAQKIVYMSLQNSQGENVHYELLTYYGTPISGQINIISATVLGQDVLSYLSVIYESSNPNILTVSSSGRWVLNGVGNVIVTITCNNTGWIGQEFMFFYVKAGQTIVVPDIPEIEDPGIDIPQICTHNIVNTGKAIYYGNDKHYWDKGCTLCGEWFSGEHNNQYNCQYTVITPSTSTSAGQKKCTVCGHVATIPQDTSYTPPVQEEPTIETIKLSRTSCTVYVGESVTLYVSGTSKTPTWSTGNSNVARVSNGVVTGVGKGTTTIQAYIKTSSGSYAYADCTVTVLDKIATVVSLTPKSSIVNVGDSVTLTASVNTNTNITWTYSNKSLGTVNQNGNTATIKMNSAGTMTITVKAGTSSATATITANESNAYSKYIYNAQQLDAVRHHLDKDFIIAADINLSSYNNWTPIGTSSAPFTGTIYSLSKSGGYYTISGLKTSGQTYAGLFGYVRSANISKMSISNANVNGTYAGALVGYAYASNINTISIYSCTVKGTTASGGVVGQATTNSSVSGASITGSNTINSSKYVGGIVGLAQGTSISNSTVNMSGSIAITSGGSGYAGGAVGNTNSSVYGVYVKANISANNSYSDYAGGIVGYTTSSISGCTIASSSINGYTAGGIGGAITTNSTVSLTFKEYKKGYRKEDLSSSSYSTDVSECAVKSSTSVKGTEVGGLFGVINSGVVSNCYTMATLSGNSSGATKGGFAASINASGFNNNGGRGTAGIVEYCYSACSFSGSGKAYSITSSLIHNYASVGDGGFRSAGYCFNYVFDDGRDGSATYYSGSNLFGKDHVDAQRSSSEMQSSSTYTAKGFSSYTWNLSGYPTLRNEA